MKLTHFPTSYPFSNKEGMVFTARIVERAAKQFINAKPPRSYEFGIEICRVLLWSMEHAKDEEHYLKLCNVLIYRILNRRDKRGNWKQVDIVLKEIVDPLSEEREDKMLYKADVENLVGDSKTVTQLSQLRKRDREKMILKLKEHMEGG